MARRPGLGPARRSGGAGRAGCGGACVCTRVHGHGREHGHTVRASVRARTPPHPAPPRACVWRSHKFSQWSVSVSSSRCRRSFRMTNGSRTKRWATCRASESSMPAPHAQGRQRARGWGRRRWLDEAARTAEALPRATGMRPSEGKPREGARTRTPTRAAAHRSPAAARARPHRPARRDHCASRGSPRSSRGRPRSTRSATWAAA